LRASIAGPHVPTKQIFNQRGDRRATSRSATSSPISAIPQCMPSIMVFIMPFVYWRRPLARHEKLLSS